MRMIGLLILLFACGKPVETIVVACDDPLLGCELPGGLSVHFSDHPVVLQTFKLSLTGLATTEPYASFQMQDMEMGLNRYRLVQQRDQYWQASVMLPACVQGRRDWLLLLEVDGKVYQIPFLVG